MCVRVCEPGAGFFCCSPLYFQFYFISNYVNLSPFTFFETISWNLSSNYLDWLELICGWHQGLSTERIGVLENWVA